MRKSILVIFLLASLLTSTFTTARAAGWTVGGTITDAGSGEPLTGAAVKFDELWSISDENGCFSISNVQTGKYTMTVTLLGYMDYSIPVNVSKDITSFKIRLKQVSLALKEVMVTAQRPKDGVGTSHNIGREALDQLQIANVADISALLPGGKTINPDLTSSNSFSIRNGGSSAGNAAFSTAVEVDGVRISNNAGFGDMAGADTRNISVDNIESVEVVSGVASAEYGDLGSGMVKINTKRGRTPYNITLSVNPRTYQASVSKGFGVGSGALNISAEYAYATKKLTSPYESYQRRGASIAYSNTFNKILRFEAAMSGNWGGMNSKDDPDAYKGAYSKVNDNVFRGSTSLTWLINKPGVTNLKFDASVNFNDNKSLTRTSNSAASENPAVHYEQEGYSYAGLLPKGKYFSDQVVDSKDLSIAASAKYTWNTRWDGYKSHLKAGAQWKSEGNAGQGEYYLLQEGGIDTAPNGYRPRPYSQYPFMHTLGLYAEEEMTFPFGLLASAGVRMDNVFVKGTNYSKTCSFSPRLNIKYNITKTIAVRAGWGLSEKLPSFNILYPKQEYRDILADSGNNDGTPWYQYYTAPYKVLFNPDLKWQKTSNMEAAVEGKILKTGFSLVGFWNRTLDPYKFNNSYSPIELQRGTVTDTTFVSSPMPSNGAPIDRAGVELSLEFPEIKPIHTSINFDASYSWTKTEDRSEYYYYNTGASHTTIPSRSYQYVGIYANGGNSNLAICGKVTHSMNANLTFITRITQAKMIITCRIEATVFNRSRNIATDGIDKVYPIAYLDPSGTRHEVTEDDRQSEDFANAFSGLIRKASNAYLFDLDGYGTYISANLNVTKEIGKHVSLSFFANNFTNTRPAVTSIATGVSAVYVPSFYYGLICRIKI